MLTKVSLYFNIICFIGLISIGYLFKLYYDKNLVSQKMIDSQYQIIMNYSKNRQDQLEAIMQRDRTIELLTVQYKNVIEELNNIEEVDETARTWSNQEYSRALVNKVLTTDINIDELRNNNN